MSKDLELEKNADAMKLLMADVKQKIGVLHQGGGQNKIDKQHAKGKMTARERISFLLDEGKRAYRDWNICRI